MACQIKDIKWGVTSPELKERGEGENFVRVMLSSGCTPDAIDIFEKGDKRCVSVIEKKDGAESISGKGTVENETTQCVTEA